MDGLLEVVAWCLLGAGVFFFFSGSVGVLRLRDSHSRLHAVTKADTLGVGLVVAGLCLRADSWQSVFLMLLVWLAVMASGAITCHVLARYAAEHQDEP